MADDKPMYGKKELRLVKIDNSALFKWIPKSGGELPKLLHSMYTGTKEALQGLQAANRMLASKSTSKDK
jgi:hypothetical protein